MKSLVFAPLALALLLPQAAQATCAIWCDVVPVRSDCTRVGMDDAFTTTEYPAVVGACWTQCCAPPSPEFPNGDCTEEESPMTADMVSILDQDFSPIPGSFSDIGLCENTYSGGISDPGMPDTLPLLEWSDPLSAGTYHVNAMGLISATFEVEEATGPGCSTTGSPTGLPAWLTLGLLGWVGLRRRE